jgi:hypothetical protein
MTDFRIEQSEFNAELIELAKETLGRIRPRLMSPAEYEHLQNIDKMLSKLKVSIQVDDSSDVKIK